MSRMTLPRVARVVFILALALVAIPANANAAVRSAAAEDGIDNQYSTPSLTPRPPLQEVVRSSLSYDDASGIVEASVTFSQPMQEWTRAEISLYGRDECAKASGSAAPYTVGDDELNGTQVAPVVIRLDNLDGSSATLDGFEGEVTGTVTQPDAYTLVTTVAHSAFAHRDYRCFAGAAEGDSFGSYFTGFDPASTAQAERARPATLPVRLVCNRGFDESNDYAGIYRAVFRPRSCFFTRDDWAHYKTVNIVRTSYKRWGQSVAYAYGTLTYNMGYRHRVKVKLYRLRPDCTGRYRVYTRIQVTERNGKRLGSVVKAETCPTA
jgi:hypothetical protein